jgi:hypothetical protein
MFLLLSNPIFLPRNVLPAETANGLWIPSFAATRPTATSIAKAATPKASAQKDTASDAGQDSCNAAMRNYYFNFILILFNDII